METTGRIAAPDGTSIAYGLTPGTQPGVVFLGGFRSDMQGTKAIFLRDLCAAQGRAFLRLDYSGHGQSGGAFEDGSIGRWTGDAEAAVLALTEGPQVVVGSSMGGWIALLLARRHPDRVVRIIGLAAAADFTTALMEPTLPPAVMAAIARDGVAHIPSDYGAPYPITRLLLEESRKNLLLEDGFDLPCPLHLVQGMADPDVPWRHALRTLDACRRDDTRLTLVRDGDHRLSRPQDLALIGQIVSD
ncbi:alpha/beta hydrolase [Humitalea sp. 24SJ18S-53]|uniref:alpha/beta hydrolase n=1 Tax=Humitalea sp. 24SJ18S-53 TaxID=3422307 RepID=UPI003D67D522